MLHVYGPHIFHAGRRRDLGYVNRYTKFVPYINRVKAVSRGRVFSLSILLLLLRYRWERCLSFPFRRGPACSIVISVATHAIPRSSLRRIFFLLARKNSDCFHLDQFNHQCPFCPESEHFALQSSCPLCAKSGERKCCHINSICLTLGRNAQRSARHGRFHIWTADTIARGK